MTTSISNSTNPTCHYVLTSYQPYLLRPGHVSKLPYTQLKYYQDNDIPLNDTYTYCTTCDKPFNIHSETCPHCDTPNEDFDYQEILVTYDNLFTPDDDYN